MNPFSPLFNAFKNKLLQASFRNKLFDCSSKTAVFEIQESLVNISYNVELDKILINQKKHLKESGTNTTTLLKGFIHWAPNTKYGNEKKIATPIFIQKALLHKVKSIEDYFKIEDNQEWIWNPVLKYILKHNFNIDLPEDIENIDFSVLQSLAESIEIDKMCITTIHYTSISIVEDLERLEVENDVPKSIEILFDNNPIKQVDDSVIDYTNIALTTNADASQLTAIYKIKQGNHLLIQGPPGTGKSQTIQNIITDAVSQNKKVLVVSEKKIALEVVHTRMSNSGLDSITAIIHDVTNDKKEFLNSLKNAYLSAQVDREYKNDEAIIAQLKSKLQIIENYYKAAKEIDDRVGVSYKDLMNQKINVSKYEENIPLFANWKSAKTSVESMIQCAKEHFGTVDEMSNVLNKLSLSYLANISSKKNDIDAWLKILTNLVCKSNENFIKYYYLSSKAFLLEEYAENGTLEVFRKNSSLHKKWNALFLKRKKNQLKLDNLLEFKNRWSGRLEDIEIENVFYLSTSFNTEDKKKAEDIIASYFDFSGLRTKPNVQVILKKYEEYKKLIDAKLEIDSEISLLTMSNNIDSFLHQYNYITSKIDGEDPDFQMLLSKDFECNDLADLIEFNFNVKPIFHNISSALYQIEKFNINEVIYTLEAVCKEVEFLLKISPYFDFKEFLKEEEFRFILKEKNIDLIDQKVLENSLAFLIMHNPILKNLSEKEIKILVDQAKSMIQIFYKENSEFIQQNILNKLKSKIELYSKPLSQRDKDQKESKKSFNEGRKILEKAFAKKTKTDSIFSMIHSPANEIILDLKKVWFCSPSAVSDIFPLVKDLFDIVIFDEASKMDVSHALPSLYRAKQVVIVGDEMQMPPSNFFTKKIEDDGENEIFESLLYKGIESLPSTVLTHHYRSKSSDLIAFSNYYFYKNELKIYSENKNTLTLHHIADGCFIDRKNFIEAENIINHLDEFIEKHPTKSIGIITFSLEQQYCIEQVLAKHKNQKLQKWIANIENSEEPFFIKNLENVQGDERDVIFISLGYGRNEEGVFRQSFGPLNNEGGERRLNVMITRAKEQMHVYSSFESVDITNIDNEGALALKMFLAYCETKNLPLVMNILDKSEKKSNYFEHYF